MQNVTINGKKSEILGETPVRLFNGALVLHYNKLGDVVGAYIVTSYRSKDYKGDSPASYCSLVNLDNGYIAFEERCSRSTTIKRVLSHLIRNDIDKEKALKEGQFIEVYPVGEYKIDLTFDRKQV